MSLLAWYKFDGDALDSWKMGWDLTEVNSPTFNTTGRLEGSMEVTGAGNEGASRSLSTEFDGLQSSGFSVSFWINYKDAAPSVNRWDHFVCMENVAVTKHTFRIYYNYDGAEYTLYWNTADTVDHYTLINFGSTNQLYENGWNLITCVWDASDSSKTLYINGTQVAQHVGILSTEYPFDNPEILYIAHEGDHDADYDDLKIYNHALTQNEISGMYSGNDIIIDGMSYFNEFVDGDLDQTALFRLRTADLILGDDETDLLLSQIENGQDVHIYSEYQLVFRGLVENLGFTEEKQISIDCIDYSYHLAEDFVTYTATSKRADEIVTELLSLYGGGLYTTNITPTTFVYASKVWRAYSPIEIIQEIAIDENYIFFVDAQRVFNFVPQNFNHTGITLEDGVEIFGRSFPQDNTKLKNKIIVIGQGATDTPGIRVVARDPVSIEKYGLRAKRIEDTSITTEEQAIERASAELIRLANPLVIGTIETDRNYTLSAGSIINVTMAQKSWVAKEFLILEAEHQLDIPTSELTLAEINPKNSDQLSDILKTQRLTAKNWEDDSVPVTHFELWYENIEVELLAFIEVQDPPSRNWNDFDYDELDWDVAPGNWILQSDPAGEIMGLTTLGLERIRDLMVGKVVTDFHADEANIAIGSGTTVFSIADTTLDTEDYRSAMDSGFPKDGAVSATTEHQASFDDGDFVSGTFFEAGLFDNTVGGLMLGRVVPSSSFSKAANENLRVRTILKFFQ